jgi:hypothetical protein
MNIAERFSRDESPPFSQLMSIPNTTISIRRNHTTDAIYSPYLHSTAMPRSVADATRFTPTAPHAHSKSPIPSSPTATSPRNTPQETPQQKVARLRAAALKAKAGRISTFDRIVVTGRAWADRAHRFVTLSLVGLTGSHSIPLIPSSCTLGPLPLQTSFPINLQPPHQASLPFTQPSQYQTCSFIPAAKNANTSRNNPTF